MTTDVYLSVGEGCVVGALSCSILSWSHEAHVTTDVYTGMLIERGVL